MPYRFGEFDLDEQRRELRRAGSVVVLQPLVLNLIILLVRNHARAVSKDELLETLWPEVTVTEASIQRVISLARSALDDHSHELIHTISGYGYRFGGDVQTEGRSSLTPPIESAPAADAPAVRYAKSADGVSIAYWTLGQGPPLVYVPHILWSHCQLEWEIPEIRRWYQNLAQGRTLVRFDLRGTGASQREVEHYSLPSLQLDLNAVVDKLGLDRFALFGDLNAAKVVLRFAAEQSERVSRLILWLGYASASDVERGRKIMRSLGRLIDEDWVTYTEMYAPMRLGRLDGELAHQYADLMRASVSPEIAKRSIAAAAEDDVRGLLSFIKASTLLIQRRDLILRDIAFAQRLAADLSDSRLVVLDGAATAPFLGNPDEVLATINDFLMEPQRTADST